MHVALNRVWAGQLREAGELDVIAFVDNLALGPVVADLDALSTARTALWKNRRETCSSAEVVDMRAVLDPRRATLVVWVGDRWREWLALWCLLHAAAAAGYAGEIRVEVARLRAGGGIAARRPAPWTVTSEATVEASTLWRAYAGSTPEGIADIDFGALRRFRGSRDSFRWYAAALPRIRTGSAHPFDLSWHDELLLAGLSDDAWRTPHDWLRGRGSEDPAVELLTELGDRHALDRWSQLERAPRPLLESRPTEGPSPWTDRELRLTADGQRALEEGLVDCDDVPGVEVGGYVAYRAPLWAAAEIGEAWSITAVS